MTLLMTLQIVGGLLLLAALVWCAVILLRLNRRWFYLYVGLMAITLLSGVVATRQTYVQVLLIPIGVLAFSQLPLLAFSYPKDGRGPFGVMALAFLLTGLSLTFDDPLAEVSWIETMVYLSQILGIFALVASSLLLMAAGWKVGRWWGIGLNPITVPMVLPVVVLRHPAEVRRPALRFLLWLAVTFLLAFVDSAMRSGDPSLPIGLAIAVVGIGAFVGGVIWLLATIPPAVVALWQISEQPMGSKIASTLRDVSAAAKTPALLAVVGAIVWLGGVVAYGDLLIDRHAMAQDRSGFAVLTGCGWSAELGALLRARSKIPKEQRLASFGFEPAGAARPAVPGARGHDPALAVALAKAALLVYADPNTIREVARKWGFADDRILLIGFGSTSPGAPGARLEKPGTDQAFVLADGKSLLIAFRGTDQFADWGTNLDFLPTGWATPEWRHHGFDGALARLRQDLLAAIRQLRDADQSVWLTGHSLGGALAVLAATPVSEAIGARVHGLYTFAQPSVAGGDLASRLGERVDAYYRFVLHRDAVPGLGTPGARHVGEIRYVDSLGAVRAVDHWTVTIKDAACASLGIIEAHGMVHYLTALELALPESSEIATRN